MTCFRSSACTFLSWLLTLTELTDRWTTSAYETVSPMCFSEKEFLEIWLPCFSWHFGCKRRLSSFLLFAILIRAVGIFAAPSIRVHMTFLQAQTFNLLELSCLTGWHWKVEFQVATSSMLLVFNNQLLTSYGIASDRTFGWWPCNTLAWRAFETINTCFRSRAFLNILVLLHHHDIEMQVNLTLWIQLSREKALWIVLCHRNWVGNALRGCCPRCDV